MKTILMTLLILVGLAASAQKFSKVDKSPLDICYYPNEFAHDRKFAPQKIGDDPAMIRVIYSHPSKNNREVFGTLVPYSKVWRLGANENTEIKLYRDAILGGQAVKAGTYTLFAIPEATEWTIILNKDLDQWGAYSYDDKKDLVRFKARVSNSDAVIENFSMVIEKSEDGGVSMYLGWDHTVAMVPIKF